MLKAIEHGPKCPQFDVFTNKLILGSEDCLHLNVYTPDLAPKTPLPVMVYMHGGGFKSGSGNDDFYGPDFLVQHGVILVTTNYRVDALGFLCLDNEDVPGNAGMKDQVAALKWVQNNIKQFGGDPDNVTVFGESAGGASTSYHILSPMSTGLFKRAIPMSGVPMCDWAQPFESRKRAFQLGKQLGLTTDDPKELLEFLQSLPVEKLLDTNPCVTAIEDIMNTVHVIKMYHFNPVVEKDFGQENFLNEDPFEALKAGKINEVDIMMGHTSEEGLICAMLAFGTELLDIYNRWPELLVPKKIIYTSSPKKVIELSERIRKHYFGNKAISNDTVKEFFKFASHENFNVHIQRFLQRLPKLGNTKRYFYQFDMRSDRDYFGPAAGELSKVSSSHMDDCWYLFHANSLPMVVNKNSKGYQMVQTTCKLFTNFAKYG